MHGGRRLPPQPQVSPQTHPPTPPWVSPLHFGVRGVGGGGERNFAENMGLMDGGDQLLQGGGDTPRWMAAGAGVSQRGVGDEAHPSLPASGSLPSRRRLLRGLSAFTGVDVLQRCCPLPPRTLPAVAVLGGVPGSDTHPFGQETERQPLCLNLGCLAGLSPFPDCYLLS